MTDNDGCNYDSDSPDCDGIGIAIVRLKFAEHKEQM